MSTHAIFNAGALNVIIGLSNHMAVHRLVSKQKQEQRDWASAGIFSISILDFFVILTVLAHSLEQAGRLEFIGYE